MKEQLSPRQNTFMTTSRRKQIIIRENKLYMSQPSQRIKKIHQDQVTTLGSHKNDQTTRERKQKNKNSKL